jgi:hypothetical protein
MNGRLHVALSALVLTAASHAATAQQVPDMDFAPGVERPQYAAGSGPSVAIDGAHRNFHTLDGGYAPFAKLLRADGYTVTSNDEPFAAAALAGIDVLVIANAMHEQSKDEWAPLPNYSAFADGEIAAVEQWVRQGGSLLLIADHMPLAGHAEALAAAFGIRFQNGFAFDSARNGRLAFRRSEGSLAATAITNGRTAAERVDSVMTFTGQAFRLDPDLEAEPLMILADGHELFLPTVAFEFSDKTPRISAANLLQGATVRHGRGRIAVFGEAAMFSAQLAGPDRRPMGMNAPDARDNYRFALNTMHWLSGAL